MLKKSMGNLRIKGKKDRIYLRFYYLSKQREEPTPFYCVNNNKDECKCRDHKAALGILAEIERKIDAGTFNYKEYFPKSAALNGLGQSVIDKSITFGAYATVWLEQQILAYSTLNSYRRIVHSILIPILGNIKISDVLPFHVRGMIKQFEGEGKKPKYIKNIIGVLSSIIVSAIADNLIDKNPLKSIKLPKIETVQVDVFTNDEINSIIDYTIKHNPNMVLFFAIGFFTGLRTGEIMGLQWSDFDFKNNKIKIQRTITERHLKIGTKTSDFRMIDIPPILDNYIQNHKQYTWLKSEWVFIGKNNDPIKDNNTITYKYWAPALKACGIRYRQAYQMRHSFASNSLAAGFPVAWVQQMLGHTTPTMLFKRYGNYIYKSDGRQGFGSDLSNLKLNKG